MLCFYIFSCSLSPKTFIFHKYSFRTRKVKFFFNFFFAKFFSAIDWQLNPIHLLRLTGIRFNFGYRTINGKFLTNLQVNETWIRLMAMFWTVFKNIFLYYFKLNILASLPSRSVTNSQIFIYNTKKIVCVLVWIFPLRITIIMGMVVVAVVVLIFNFIKFMDILYDS